MIKEAKIESFEWKYIGDGKFDFTIIMSGISKEGAEYVMKWAIKDAATKMAELTTYDKGVTREK